ncbi:hypothetical protein [Aeromonas salmonicida]|uniref:hypothetical protein n=1 Tax=Aeromonas salmonicida TaxID=645 RepID=UPI001B66D8CA|nr:hypothetical protein [Aeromonadaceae bacterium]
MGLWKTLTTINGNSLGGLIIKLIYNVPKMSDTMIIDVVTGRKWAPEFIKLLAAKEGAQRSLKM